MKIDYQGIRKMLRREQIFEIVGYGEAALPCLFKALKDKDKYVRANAAEALGEMEVVAAVPALIAALGDRSKNMGETAKEALIYIGRPAVPALLEALEDGNNKIRKSIAEILVAINELSVTALIDAVGKGGGKKEKARVLLDMVNSRIAVAKKERQNRFADGELLEGETVKPPKKAVLKKKPIIKRIKNM
jgi:HEAT repeat protein